MQLHFHESCKQLAKELHSTLLPGLLGEYNPDENYDSPYDLIKNTPLFSLALQHSMDDGIEWAEKLHSTPQKYDWHMIVLNIESESESSICVAKSQYEAIAYAMEQLDERAVFLSSIDEAHGTFRFLRDGKEVAIVKSLSPLVKHPAQAMVTRVAHCLQRVHTKNSDHEIQQRFKSIRGLEVIKSEDSAQGAARPYTLSTIALVNQMTEFLLQISSKTFIRSEVLEITARFFGFSSWNSFTGAEKKHRELRSFDYPYLISWDLISFEGSDRAVVCSLGPAAGLACFAEIVSNGERPTEITIHRWLGFGATATYADGQQLYLSLMRVVTVSDLSPQVRNSPYQTPVDLLSQSGTAVARLHQRAKRRSAGGQHSLIGRWLVYIEPAGHGYHGLVLEHYNVELTHCLDRFTTLQYKSSLQLDSEGEVWLAGDWDRKPVHKLTGMFLADALELEKTLIRPENYRLNVE